MDEISKQIVAAMGKIHGIHEGFRAVHAKGSCCKGIFVATPEAATICIAPHFQGDEIPVTVRFSNGSGKPTRADGAKDERGMAVKFHLADGRTTDLVSLTLPVFFVRNPQDFLVFLQAQEPDPATGKPDLERVQAFVDAHPETQTAIGFVLFNMAPASYANCSFNALHAFKMTAPDGAQRFVRYRWEAEAGEATLTDEETRALGRNYLQEELEKRLAAGTVSYDLFFQIGEEDDDPTDPTVAWPPERRMVAAGRLTLTDYLGTECEPMIFDPGRLVDGIEPSGDLILQARSPAYSVSFERRSGVPSA